MVARLPGPALGRPLLGRPLPQPSQARRIGRFRALPRHRPRGQCARRHSRPGCPGGAGGRRVMVVRAPEHPLPTDAASHRWSVEHRPALASVSARALTDTGTGASRTPYSWRPDRPPTSGGRRLGYPRFGVVLPLRSPHHGRAGGRTVGDGAFPTRLPGTPDPRRTGRALGRGGRSHPRGPGDALVHRCARGPTLRHRLALPPRLRLPGRLAVREDGVGADGRPAVR